ncbi:unnamed protein product [Brassica oleracea]|uniref:(rape) hypothetical protein n=1 Tax=Brassica napus TaxID=3708 RepID=A0A816KX89_BRANA|nr:unnamed protein product [Brassica napus]
MPTREQFLQFLQQNPLSDGTPIYVDSFQGFETYYSQLNQANINVTNIPSTSSTPAAAPTPHMTVDDLLGAPGRESLTVLDPLRRGRATWFKYDKGKISKAILKMMKSDLPGAYPTYNHLPRDIIENGGEEPGMLAFLEDAHRNRKTGDICDKKVKQIVETVKEKINDQLTQGRSTETNHLTQAEINTLVLRETPILKGHRFGFGTLPEPGQPPSSARFMPNLDQDEQLRIASENIALADEKIAMANEKIATLENDKVDQGKVIKYLQNLAHKVVSKFPELLDEDEDATQE